MDDQVDDLEKRLLHESEPANYAHWDNPTEKRANFRWINLLSIYKRVRFCAPNVIVSSVGAYLYREMHTDNSENTDHQPILSSTYPVRARIAAAHLQTDTEREGLRTVTSDPNPPNIVDTDNYLAPYTNGRVCDRQIQPQREQKRNRWRTFNPLTTMPVAWIGDTRSILTSALVASIAQVHPSAFRRPFLRMCSTPPKTRWACATEVGLMAVQKQGILVRWPGSIVAAVVVGSACHTRNREGERTDQSWL